MDRKSFNWDTPPPAIDSGNVGNKSLSGTPGGKTPGETSNTDYKEYRPAKPPTIPRGGLKD